MRRAPPISLTPLERAWLEAWATVRSTADRLSVRARVVLEASQGSPNSKIANKLGIHPETVGRWRQRFALNRLEGVRRDAPRSGGRSTVPDRLVERIVQLTATEPGPTGGHWTTRTLARALKINHMVVQRVWKAYGLAGAARPSWFDLPARSRTVRVELLGVYAGAPVSAIVFRTRTSTRESRTLRTAPPLWLSGGYADTVEPRLPSALTGFLLEIESSRSGSGHRSSVFGSSHELLVFLRGIEEEPGSPPARLHVIFDTPLDLLPERVVHWLRSHTRLRPVGTAPGATWTTTVNEWMRAFSGATVHPESFREVEALLESSAAFGADVRRGFCWSHGGGPLERPFTSALAPVPPTLVPRAAPP